MTLLVVLQNFFRTKFTGGPGGGDRYPTSNPGQWDGQMGGPYPSGMPGGAPPGMYAPSGPYPMQPYPARPEMGQGGYPDPYYGGGAGGAGGGYPDNNRYNPVYDNRLPDDRQYMDRRPPPAAGPYPYDNKMPPVPPNVPQMYPDQRYPPSRGYPASKYPDRGGIIEILHIKAPC